MPRLLGALNAERAQRGAGPLMVDRGLALVAQQASANYQRLVRGQERCEAGDAARELSHRVAQDAARELAVFSLSFEHVLALAVCVDQLEQAVSALQRAVDPELRFAGLLDPKLRFAGLSVAAAPGDPAGFAVVLTLGW